MKKVKLVQDDEVGMLMSCIGNVDLKANGKNCIVSEKNLKSILNTLNAISAGETATRFANSVMKAASYPNFTVIKFQEMMTEEQEHIQFLIDCGELLVGDDAKIKEFLNSPAQPEEIR